MMCTAGISSCKHAWCTIAVLLLVGCQRSNGDRVVIYASGDTSGWITPCGCASNQSGGLARRSTLFHQSESQPSNLILDVGGSASGTSAYQRVKLESILLGMQAMGLAMHNIGQGETDLGPQELRRLSEKTGVKWLSTNLTSVEGDWNPCRFIVEKRGESTIAILGVIDANLVSDQGWQTQDPVAAIISALRDANADTTIVLAYMDQPELLSLASALPEVDAVIGGPTGQSMSPIKVGSTTVLSATNKGKFVARVVIDPAGDGGSHRTGSVIDASVAEVTSSLEEDPVQLAILSDYYDRLSKIDFPAHETGLISSLAGDRDDYAVAGSEQCKGCHAQDDMSWQSSKHSHAWEVLVKKAAQYDPTCQQCHSTGYGLKGGFKNVSTTPSRIHVGCENCHGPSLAHVENPRSKTPWVAKEQCVRCHDHENSPAFELNAYWAKILHGLSADHTGESTLSNRTSIQKEL